VVSCPVRSRPTRLACTAAPEPDSQQSHTRAHAHTRARTSANAYRRNEKASRVVSWWYHVDTRMARTLQNRHGPPSFKRKCTQQQRRDHNNPAVIPTREHTHTHEGTQAHPHTQVDTHDTHVDKLASSVSRCLLSGSSGSSLNAKTTRISL